LIQDSRFGNKKKKAKKQRNRKGGKAATLELKGQTICIFWVEISHV